MAKPKRMPFSFPEHTYFVTSKCWGGQHLLQSERNARLLLDTIFKYREQGKYLLHAFVIMPDHMHVLLSPLEITLERAVQLIKGGYSYRVSKELGSRRELWQRGFSDHRIRDRDDFQNHIGYIHRNPVKRGLCVSPEQFSYSSANGTLELDPLPQWLKPDANSVVAARINSCPDNRAYRRDKDRNATVFSASRSSEQEKFGLSTTLDIPVIDNLIRDTPFHGKLHYFERTESTNVTANIEALGGVEEGSVYIADAQTGGRGRGGHSWHSEPGAGIYLSAVLRPRLLPTDLLWFSLAAGLAVRTAVEEVTSLVPDLRWPNDLLLHKKKFCGILTEMNAEPTRTRFVVVGIGMNVNHDGFPSELQAVATSLRLETGREYQREPLIGALLRALHNEYTGLAVEGGPASIRRRFEAASSSARGKRVHVEEGDYTGTTEGLDDRGFLRVRTETGLRTVLSGGVREIAPA